MPVYLLIRLLDLPEHFIINCRTHQYRLHLLATHNTNSMEAEAEDMLCSAYSRLKVIMEFSHTAQRDMRERNANYKYNRNTKQPITKINESLITHRHLYIYAIL